MHVITQPVWKWSEFVPLDQAGTHPEGLLHVVRLAISAWLTPTYIVYQAVIDGKQDMLENIHK